MWALALTYGTYILKKSNIYKKISEESMENNIPQSLLNAFASKRLIPIVGAGVSMSLRSKNGEGLFPSWGGLLQKAADFLKLESDMKSANLIEALLSYEDYEQAASVARKGLTGSLWSRFFNDIFEVKLDELSEESMALPKAIWNISNQVITLNYDKVLRLTCPNQSLIDFDNNNTDALASFSRAEKNHHMLWHMHGHIDNSNDITFTSESYSKLYNNTNSQYLAALTKFRTICTEKQLIFVGCSLDDADLLKQISDQHQLFANNTGPHYALVKECDIKIIETKLKGLPIRLVGFSDFGEPLINAIKQITSIRQIDHIPPSIVKATNLENNSKQTIIKIAILSAKPLDKNFKYDLLESEFKKLKAEITLQHLSLFNLNELEGHDYIFILSKIIKNKIAIEDEVLTTGWINLKELEENLGNKNTKGVFIFLDHQNKNDIDVSPLEPFAFPILIFPQLTKNQVESFGFKIFKKKSINYVEESLAFNIDSLQIYELKDKGKEWLLKTKLPANIDPRTTKNYVGRKNDLENICRKILELRNRGELLTIKGSGGIGKTITVKKLAVEFANRNFFKDGIDFIECEFIATYKAFEDNIARCFNLENALNVQALISENYGNQDRLIILDNLETLLNLPFSDQVKNLLSFISEFASIVITSRELTSLHIEQTYELRPFTTDEAYELFVRELPWGSEIIEVDKRIIREGIIEPLLDNNPLAIKLVTKNIPKGKRFEDLKIELETNFFRKVSDSELEAFDSASDVNIERKKSLYGSINFSYQYLNDKEKVAFELLSLFPDGINLERFKQMSAKEKALRSEKEKQKVVTEDLIITDHLIKALENKSLIQNDNNEIRLQSIVGKFADHKFKQRDAGELERFYKNAFDYNYRFANILITHSFENNLVSLRIFNNHQNNFIKSIQFIEGFKFDNKMILLYVSRLVSLFTKICGYKTLIQALKEQNLVFENPNQKLCYDVSILVLKYFNGEFNSSYEKLRTILPLDKLLDLNSNDSIEEVTQRAAMSIYSMEGETLISSQLTISKERDLVHYPPSFFQLGFFSSGLISKLNPNFTSLETSYALGLLNKKKIEEYIEKNLYEKSHLEITQTNYIKAKMGLLNKRAITPLVTVNPYTIGLKQLMFAFVESDYDAKQSFFNQALENLIHIKYYYVEALFFYATFLKENQQPDFAEIHLKGADLARKHQYRYLSHKFDQLINETNYEYDVSNYPLPIDQDISKYSRFLIKG